MASSDDIATVRKNTNEVTESKWTDTTLDGLIDSFGVAGASAKVWEQKAAEAAELVNTTEAGASHAYSDLHKHCLAMADYWYDQQYATDNPTPVLNRVRVKQIERQ